MQAVYTSDFWQFHFITFGMQMMGRKKASDEYRFGFQSQEKETEITGSESHSFFKYRISDNRLGRFFSVDPLASKYPYNSTYAFSENRVIDGIELEGLEVVLTGNFNQEAFQELQLSVSNELILNMAADGVVTATLHNRGGVIMPEIMQNNSSPIFNPIDFLSPKAKMLFDATNSSTIRTNIIAEDTKITSTGQLYIGGAFMGNTVTPTPTGNTVIANQEVNPNVLRIMSNTHNRPGEDMLHEVTEAYQGALISQSSGVSSPRAGIVGSVYNQSHSSATPQSGNVSESIYDISGNKLLMLPGGVYPPGTNSADWSVKDASGNDVIIQTFP